jgi:PAS domain S-box-containing protein
MTLRGTARRQSPQLAVTLALLTVLGGLPGTAMLLLSSEGPAPGPLVAVVATLALSGLTAAIGSHVLVSTPLRAVRVAVERLRKNDFTRRPHAGGGGEIAAVVRALDELGQQLERRLTALSTAERRYRLLHDHGPAAQFRTRLDGRVVECNAAAVRLLGYDSVTDVTARNAAAHYADPRDRAMVIERLRRHGFLGDVPLDFRRKDGRPVPVRLTVVQTQEQGETYLDSIAVEAGEVIGDDDRAPASAVELALPAYSASGAAAMASSSRRV